MSDGAGSCKIAVFYEPEDVTSVEWLEARANGDGFIIIDTPVYAVGLSSGDVVSVTSWVEGLRVSKIVRSGGFATFRVLANDEAAESRLVMDLLQRITETGADVSSPVRLLYTVNVRMGLPLTTTLRILDHGSAQGLWDYAIGNIPIS